MYGAYGAGYGQGYGQGYSASYGQGAGYSQAYSQGYSPGYSPGPQGCGYAPSGYNAAPPPGYQSSYAGHARPAMPPRPPLPGMDPASGVVWPGGQRPPGPIVKAGNLAKDITVPDLKQALTKWGVDGIKEVLLTESRFGQVALFLFKEVEQAQLMMMAQGVEVAGRPLMLEFLPAPKGSQAAEKKPAREAKIVTEIIKVSNLPKKLDKYELVTHLRSHGVLGIAQVVLERQNTALVRFNEEKDVPKAIDKANNTTFKEKKLTLEAFPGHWDTLFPDGDPAEYRGEESQGGSRGSRRDERSRREERSERSDSWGSGGYNGYGQPVSGHHPPTPPPPPPSSHHRAPPAEYGSQHAAPPPPEYGSHHGAPPAEYGSHHGAPPAEYGRWSNYDYEGYGHSSSSHRDHGGYSHGSWKGGYGSHGKGPY